MRFVVIGAGAVGGVLGGRLFAGGFGVHLVARGAHYEALARDGLRLETPEEAVTLPVPVSPTVAEAAVRSGDVVLVCTKSQDTITVVEALAAVAPPDVPVVCVQNGVDNERSALRLFSDVYGVSVMCPTTHLRPGVVEANASPVTGLLDVGRWPAGADDLCTSLTGALRSVTFDSVPRHDIARWKYGKLLLNLTNAVEAACGAGARHGELSRRIRSEAVACFEAAGIDYVGAQEDAARRGDLLRLRPVGGRPRGGSSSWQSLVRSTGAIETDYLNGEIALLGRLHGVPTPANAAIQRRARDLAVHRRAPGSVPEEEVLADLDR